jgi:hypothetical protein
MPVYKNDTSQTISYNGETWKPEATKAVAFFVPDEQGLILLSREPLVGRQALDSGVMTLETGATVRLYVPACNEFMISLVASSGSALVRENYEDNSVATEISANRPYKSSARRTNIEAYHITGTSTDAATISYIISRMS